MRTTSLWRETMVYAALSVLVIVMMAPFAWVAFGAFKSQAEILSDPGALLPDSFLNFDNFIVLFSEKRFATYMANSVIVSTATVVANVLFSAMAGYALAKLRFRGRAVVFGGVLLGMMVPYVALFVPQFIVIVQLRLVDTLAGIAAPMLVFPVSVFIMRQFADSVPNDLLEAARIDGAGEMRIFFQIFFPLVGPAAATVAIISFLNSWNYFLWPLIVAQSTDTYTLPVGLAIASQGAKSTEYGILLAGAVVVMLPVLIVFLLLQKYFVQGIALTGIK